MVLDDDFEMQHRSMLQNKVNMQNNVLTKRREQLKHWELSEVNKMTATRKPATQAKVKFQDSDVFLSACISGDEEEVEDLLDKGANINVSTIDGVTALHQAVIDDNLDIVRFLVEHGADIDAQDNEGWTPLHAAVCCGSLPIAKFLCEKGADLTLTNSDKELAVDLAEDDEIRLYLDGQMRFKNVDVEKCREREFTVMMHDCNEWIRTGRYLDKPHSRTGATALHVAASKGYNELIELLIRAGADVNVRDVEGWTPLHAAAHWAEKEACRLLIENGASIEAETYSGQNVLMVADKTVSGYLMEILEKVREKRQNGVSSASGSGGAPVKKRRSSKDAPPTPSVFTTSLSSTVSGGPTEAKAPKTEEDNYHQYTANVITGLPKTSKHSSANFASASASLTLNKLSSAVSAEQMPIATQKSADVEMKNSAEDEEEFEEEVEYEDEEYEYVEEEEANAEQDEELSAETVSGETETSSSSAAAAAATTVAKPIASTSVSGSAQAWSAKSSTHTFTGNVRSSSTTNNAAENNREVHDVGGTVDDIDIRNVGPPDQEPRLLREVEKAPAASTSAADEEEEDPDDEAATGSNISSIETRSRSVTPKERSSGVYSSDQNVEGALVPSSDNNNTSTTVPNNAFLAQQKRQQHQSLSGKQPQLRTGTTNTAVLATPSSRPWSVSSTSCQTTAAQNSDVGGLAVTTTATTVLGNNNGQRAQQNPPPSSHQNITIRSTSAFLSDKNAPNSNDSNSRPASAVSFHRGIHVESTASAHRQPLARVATSPLSSSSISESTSSSATVASTSAAATTSSASPSPTVGSATVMFRKNSATSSTPQPSINTTSLTTTATFSIAPSIASCSAQQSQMRKANFGGEMSQATSGSTPSTPTFAVPWPPVRPSVTRSGSVNSGFVASMASKMSTTSGAEETNGIPAVGRRLLKQTISTSAKISAKIPPQQQPSLPRQESVPLSAYGVCNIAGGCGVTSSPLQQRPSFLIRAPMTTMTPQSQPFAHSVGNVSSTATTTSLNNNNNMLGVNGGMSGGGSGSSALQLSTTGFSMSSQTPPTQPSSHKESEAERKAKSRLQRHSRRSTQGVTLEQIGEAARQASASSSSVEKEDISERTKTSGLSSSFMSSGRRNYYHDSTTPTGAYHHHYQNHQGGGAMLTSSDFTNSTAVPPTSSSINSSGTQKKDSVETLPKNNISNSVESAGSVGSIKSGGAAAESSSDNAMEERAYRLLYETECQTSERLRKRVEDLSARMTQMSTSTGGIRGGAFSVHGSTMDDQERRAFERRIAALEYELERSKQVQSDYEKLKDENMALIRVLKKLSK